LKGVDKSDIKSIVAVFKDAGDSVMQRLFYHVNADGFHIDEQIDRNTGSQTSAKNLTWSYANLLTSLKRREAIEIELSKM